ncbi:phospholipase C [Amycolatopsis echigonensis]|uniref:Phospholipase C n=2 Tax=Amycolatopsis echigonensis TaxID=2576905 RepID=A0A2N3X1I3_9PSEU|nr:phospholipase C [Amycolatopsis niigatensis]
MEMSKITRVAGGVAATAALTVAAAMAPGTADSATPSGTATPIKHVVVIYQENVSFDHYFGTYPHAANTDGQRFQANPKTPKVNGLTPQLLTRNPNSSNPRRLGPAQALTCDQDHEYKDEQAAYDNYKMDKFIETVGNGDPGCEKRQVMDYYDGNTVTAMWNYAQHFAMSDNSYGTTFGPSTPGAVNLVSGQTHGVTAQRMPGGKPFPEGETIANTIVGDPQPLGDDCSSRDQVRLSGRNVGDLLNEKNVTWGWFEGGFKPAQRKADGTAVCTVTQPDGSMLGGHPVGAALGNTGQKGWKGDYIPHHEPFQYYPSTANPHHLPPSSPAMIGRTDQANHQYDLTDFWAGANSGHLPAVSFLKAAGYQDGHAGYSDPIDEQQFVADTINRLQKLPEWRDTAVVLAYDDSDGWYDHQAGPLVNQSQSAEDTLTGAGQCGHDPAKVMGGYKGRCGYGPRLPLLVISPWANRNHVDHAVTDQTSVLKFVEDNWSLGRIGDSSFDARAGSLDGLFNFKAPSAGRLFLDPKTGQRVDD